MAAGAAAMEVGLTTVTTAEIAAATATTTLATAGRGLMAAFGGVGGIIALIGFGLYELIKASAEVASHVSKDTQDLIGQVDQLATSYDSLTKAQRTNLESGLILQQAQLEEQIKKQKELVDSQQGMGFAI